MTEYLEDPKNIVKSMVERGLLHQPRKTEDELRIFIQNITSANNFNLPNTEIEQIAREIEHKQGIKAGLASVVVDTKDFEPWLDSAKSSIEPFYWRRYQELLVKNGLPKDVILSTDTVTDKILSRLGDPKKSGPWDRRGMVVGHVQSGKTANYTGLICKAADAGYRLIIVIAGIHNNLRNQTQARIDEGFIGRDTGKTHKKKIGGARYIGVGKFDPTNTPVSLTNTLRDFNKDTASTNTSEIDSYKVPVVLIIKKNYRTLINLLNWLKDNSARGDQEMIDQPMLLIDDEADNASINTKYGKELVTTINGQIRDLLNIFHRRCYIGYTATPFANIFIDPDQDDEMYNEDLFPKDFIIGLDAPSNYFGATRVFVDGLPEDDKPKWLRYIADNEDSLPIKHKIDHELDSLPPSLKKALRAFLLTRTIRNLRGQKASHCSMLVNASRFTSIQTQIRNRIHEKLDHIKNSVRINAGRGADALNDREIAKLHAVWHEEYSEAEINWTAIQSNLFDAIASTKVVEVNSRANDLEYPHNNDRGQTVVAVGGFSLSRGLTLEGLTVTWFLRNSMMYDTLMQMGRWFGYREHYDDLCRIWMPTEAIEWYAFIANAADELHDELRVMDATKATPRMFGLAVRSHPASLLVTARNKMGSGQKVVTKIGLSNKFVETARISIKPSDLTANLNSAKSLVSKLNGTRLQRKERPRWGILFREVPFEFIDRFLAGWHNAEQSVATDTGPVRSYIHTFKDDDLQKWDLLIPSRQNGTLDTTLGESIVPITRYVNLNDLKHELMSFGGKRMRVASPDFEKAGVDDSKVENAERQFRQEKHLSEKGVNYPGSIYRKVRDRGLFILYCIKAKAPSGEEKATEVRLIPSTPVIAWGMSLPPSSRPTKPVEYIVNAVRLREMYGEEEEEEDQDHALET